MQSFHSNSSLFEQISSLLTVGEMASSVDFVFDASTTIHEIYDEIIDREKGGHSFICLVTQQDAPIGFLDFPSDFGIENMALSAGEVATPVDMKEIIAANTPLLHLIPLWKRSYYFFVLTEHRVTHFIARPDMDKMPVKLALFALLMEVEQRMTSRLLADPERATEFFQHLDIKTQKSAQKLSKDKHPDTVQHSAYAHLQNLYFSGKVEIFLRSSELRAQLPFENEDKARIAFKFLNSLRNELAHGGSLFNIIRDARELEGVVDTLQSISTCLQKK